MNDTTEAPAEVTPLHVELPAQRYRDLRNNARNGHRTLKGELLRLMDEVYGPIEPQRNESEQTATNQTAVA